MLAKKEDGVEGTFTFYFLLMTIHKNSSQYCIVSLAYPGLDGVGRGTPPPPTAVQGICLKSCAKFPQIALCALEMQSDPSPFIK